MLILPTCIYIVHVCALLARHTLMLTLGIFTSLNPTNTPHPQSHTVLSLKVGSSQGLLVYVHSDSDDWVSEYNPPQPHPVVAHIFLLGCPGSFFLRPLREPSLAGLLSKFPMTSRRYRSRSSSASFWYFCFSSSLIT